MSEILVRFNNDKVEVTPFMPEIQANEELKELETILEDLGVKIIESEKVFCG